MFSVPQNPFAPSVSIPHSIPVNCTGKEWVGRGNRKEIMHRENQMESKRGIKTDPKT